MMKQNEYKHEKYREPDFPVYSSVQSGREELVIIHYHSAVEIMRVLDGTVSVLFNDVYKECKKGDIVFFPPSVMHGVKALDEKASIKGVTFEHSVLGRLDETRTNEELLRSGAHLQQVMSEGQKGYRELSECLDCFDKAYGDYSLAGKLKMKGALIGMMGVIVDEFRLETLKHDKNAIRLALALDYVRLHYTEKISVNELSEIVHVCDDRVIRLFKEVTGRTPVEYIMSLRIEHALKLLGSTDMSIAEIADESGFGSDTYMTRTFRQRLNLTPGEYRRKTSKPSK